MAVMSISTPTTDAKSSAMLLVDAVGAASIQAGALWVVQLEFLKDVIDFFRCAFAVFAILKIVIHVIKSFDILSCASLSQDFSVTALISSAR
jgi:large-conductance mechanosensitive channel